MRSLLFIAKKWLMAPKVARSDKWPTVRKKHLEEQPFCKYCGGIASCEVHHMRPFYLYPELELDDTNLITLCEESGLECHFVIGHFKNWKTFNPNVLQQANSPAQGIHAT